MAGEASGSTSGDRKGAAKRGCGARNSYCIPDEGFQPNTNSGWVSLGGRYTGPLDGIHVEALAVVLEEASLAVSSVEVGTGARTASAAEAASRLWGGPTKSAFEDTTPVARYVGGGAAEVVEGRAAAEGVEESFSTREVMAAGNVRISVTPLSRVSSSCKAGNSSMVFCCWSAKFGRSGGQLFKRGVYKLPSRANWRCAMARSSSRRSR